MIADLSHFSLDVRHSSARHPPTPTPTCPLSRSLSSPTTVDPCCHSASSSFWIGAYDSYLEGSFLWLDGSHVDYNDAWANNNPAQQEGARTNSDCMRVAKVDDQWRWLDAGCDVALDGFACSPISPPLPPSPPAPPLVTTTCAAAAHHQAAKFRVLFALLSTLHQPSGTGFRSSARHSFGRFVLQRTTGPRQGVLPLIASVCDELLPGLILSDRVAPCEQPANRPCGGETQKDRTERAEGPAQHTEWLRPRPCERPRCFSRVIE